MTKKKVEEPKFSVKAPQVAEMQVTIKGVTPLVVHAFGKKARDQFLNNYGTRQEETTEEKQNKKREVKVDQTPHEQYREALYYMPGTQDTKNEAYGIPASGFQKAMASIGKAYKLKYGGKSPINGTGILKAVRFLDDGGGLVKIKTKGGPCMREDWVRINGRTPQLRFRPEFADWSCGLRIHYDMELLSAAEVLNILIDAGMSIGWGELRPEKGAGSCGMWEIVNTSVKVKQICGAVND